MYQTLLGESVLSNARQIPLLIDLSSNAAGFGGPRECWKTGPKQVRSTDYNTIPLSDATPTYSGNRKGGHRGRKAMELNHPTTCSIGSFVTQPRCRSVDLGQRFLEFLPR